MQQFSDRQRRWRLAERHRLTPAKQTDSVATIADDLVALHSSDPASVFMSVFARMHQPDVEKIETALYDDRTIVRHHAMRRTIWVMTPEVARLAHGAATAKIATAERKRTEAALADTTDIADPSAWLDDSLAEIVSLLDRLGEMSTRAIGKALPHLVVPVTFGANQKQSATLNAHTKVLQGAGFNGDLVRGRPSGSWISAEYLWNPTVSWLGTELRGLDERSAAADLLERWLRRFGPATATDIRWWFGWTATIAKTALADAGAESVELDRGEVGYVAAGDTEPLAEPGAWVRLLPGLDPTPMGWKERDWYLDPSVVSRLFDRFGNAGPTVWADGQVVGGWGQRVSGEIAYDLTTGLTKTQHRMLDDAVDQMQSALDGVVVRPRFPAPVQKQLYT